MRYSVSRKANWFARDGTWAVCLLAVGCHSIPTKLGGDLVSCELQPRVGHSIRMEFECSKPVLPSGVVLAEGVSEDQAVAVALWNNAQFLESLTDLGVAEADLIQAGLLPNPEFVYFPPVPERSFKYLFDLQLEALWLRGLRTEAARLEAARVAKRLVQSALDLMRDVRIAHSDVLLAKERLRIADESMQLRKRIADLARRRLEAGDISPQESSTAAIDALQAEQDALRLTNDLPIVEERLRHLMGINASREPLIVASSAPSPAFDVDVDTLAEGGMATRPDALAAEFNCRAAQERLKLVKVNWFRLLFIGDATSGPHTHTFGPGFRITLPIFNWNQGAVARAEAEWTRACRQRETVRQQIMLDVQRAYRQHRQAVAELAMLRTKVQPEVEIAIRRNQKAYEEGNFNYLLVLEATRQLLDSQTREAQLEADVRRTWAELERSVGGRLTRPVVTVPEEAIHQ